MEEETNRPWQADIRHRIGPGWGYGLAIAAAGVALGIQLGLYPWLGVYHPWSAFYVAIVGVAWWIGWRPALVTAALGLFAGMFFILPPQASFRVRGIVHWAQIWTYAGVTGAMILLVRLARREQDFSAVLANSLPGLFYLLDSQGRLHRWNQQVELVTGYSAQELAQIPVDRLIAAEDRALAKEQIEATFTTGEGRAGLRILTRDGRQIPYLCTGRRVQVGQRPWLIGVALDLSERQRAEEQLRQSREMLTLVLDTVPVRVFWKDLNSVFLGCNRPLAQDAGLASPDQIIGKTDAELAWREQADLYRADDQKVIESGQPKRNYEEPQTTPEGKRLWLRTNKVPLRDGQGRIIGVLGTYEDITQYNAAQEALRASEERFRVLAAATFEAICISEHGRIVDANDQMAKMLGCQREELIGTEILSWLRPEDAPQVLANVRAERESHIEHSMQRKDGSQLVVEAHGKTAALAGRRLRFTAIRDITERKRAEQQLLNQTRRLGLLNEATARLLSAQEPNSVMAELYERLREYFQMDGLVEFELSDQGLCLTTCLGLEMELRASGPERLRQSEGLAETVVRARRPLVQDRIQESGDPKARLMRELGIRACACYPLMVTERLFGTLAFASRRRDFFQKEDLEFFETISSYLAMAKERLRLARELRQYTLGLEQQVAERTAKLQESMDELEHMSYSIIHDLRAPLRAMMSYGQILLQEAGGQLSGRHQDFLQRIAAATHRMDLLITDALNYNKAVRSRWPLAPLDPAQLLGSMLRTYPEFQPPAADIQLQGEFPWVLGNQAALTQCFSNLLNNAVKFVAPGQIPKVRIWAERCSGTSAAQTPAAPSFVRIWFEDNGIGIPKAAQEKLFAMFQRLHGGEYAGTGIGLALVRKVTERMGGRVGVESELGQGSRFWVELQSAQQGG